VVGIIAIATLREALRRRWILGMLGLTVTVLAFSSAFTRLQPGEELKMLRDFGIGFIIIMTVGMTIILGAGLVPPEIERRTIYTILAKPIRRLEYLLGKFLGLAFALGLNLLLIGSVFLVAYSVFFVQSAGVTLALQGDASASRPSLLFDLANLTNALLLHYGQLVLLSAMALLLSLIVTPITTIMFCVTAYFGGQMSSYWGTLGSGARTGDANTPGLSKPMQGLMSAIYYVLPRLDRFDVREKLVNDSPVTFAYLWRALDFATVYVAVLLAIAILIFSDREF
jgi:ABC-type transport system involved in multi-copper enzyme maturation permease subunit